MAMFAGCAGKPAESASASVANSEPAAASASTSVSAASTEPLKIGVWEPITGALAGGGAQKLEGYKLAQSLRPTVLGRTVEFVIADNKSDKVEAANSMARLVEKEKVPAILGCYGSSLALAGIDIAEKAKIPTIPCASNPLVIQGRKYVARSNYEDPFGGTVMAVYAIKNLSAKTAVILKNIAEDYSVGLCTYFTEAFEKRGGKILQVINYTSGDQDFTAQLNTLKSLSPDVMFMPGYYQEAALVCRQIKEMGIKVGILGSDGWVAPELISIGGDAVEGITLNGHFCQEQAKENPAAKTFLDAFQKMYNKIPTSDAATAYTNYNMLMDAIEAAGDPTKSDDIMKFLRNLKDYQAPTGLITTDPATGVPSKSAPVLELKNGEFVYVATVNPND
jgi:branched-chain amino acid transport system substrate-binding protein